jgi:hypothetical protein
VENNTLGAKMQIHDIRYIVDALALTPSKSMLA